MESPLVQVLLSMIFHLLTLGLHCYAQPYIDENVNRLESVLLSIVCMFTIGGTYFYSEDVGMENKERWSIVLLVLFLFGAILTPLAVAFDVLNKRSADGAEAILTNRINSLIARHSGSNEQAGDVVQISDASASSSFAITSIKSPASKGIFDLVRSMESASGSASALSTPKGAIAKVCAIWRVLFWGKLIGCE